MNELSLLGSLKTNLIRNQLRSFRNESRLKIYVLAVASILIWYGLYQFFYEGITFLYQSQYSDFVEPLISIVFHLLFLSLILMLTFSNGIICYLSLFSSEEIWFFRTSPLLPENIFLYKLTETISFSSWAFLFLATPLIVAYGIAIGAPLLYFPYSVILLGGAVLLPAALGSLITIVIARWMPQKRLYIFFVGAAIFLPILIWGVNSLVQFELQQQTIVENWLTRVIGSLEFSRNLLLPSSWIAQGFISSAHGKWKESAFFLLFLFANGMLLTLLSYHAASLFLRTAWKFRLEGKGTVQKRSRRRLFRIIKRKLPRFFRFVFSFLEKDFVSFIRTPAQWAQFMIFFGLLGIYFFNLRYLDYHVRTEWWRLMISFMNLGATTLTLASFTTRFIFPQLSMEGKRFWVSGMAPIQRRTLLFSKFLFSLFMSTVICVPLISISVYMLQLKDIYFALQIGVIIGACAGLSGLAVGTGAVFPVFTKEEPSKIISGFGGTLNLVLSLGFVLALLICGATPVYLVQTGSIHPDDPFGLFLITSFLSLGILTVAAATYIPMKFGIRSLKNLSL